MPIVIDGHLDLAWNALSYDRDQTRQVQHLRRSEAALAEPGSGQATVSLPEMRRGRVAVCLGSLLARVRPGLSRKQRPDRTDIDHPSQSIAHAVARGQLAYYRLLEQQGHVQILHDQTMLGALWSRWQASPTAQDGPPIGVVLAMEGADPIVDPNDIGCWWRCGLRAMSLAHYGPSAYGGGTPLGPGQEDAGLTDRGRQLLGHCQRWGIMLDLTHAGDTSFDQAFELYTGPVFASHSNCRALVDGPRQLSDSQIVRIANRGGVVGCVLEVSMLDSGWRRGTVTREAIGLDRVADHVDHVCQLAGSVDHAAIGSDLDGGFGTERCPHDLNTIADLARVGPLLSLRGYSDRDVELILHGNWLRFLRRSLPTAGGSPAHPDESLRDL